MEADFLPWYKAMLCLLIRQAGGEVQVPAELVLASQRACALLLDIDDDNDIVRMGTQKRPEMVRPAGNSRLPAGTVFCLADVAGEHCWTGTDFIPVADYCWRREDLLHFPTLKEADRAVAQCRRDEVYLRVMVVLPGQGPMPMVLPRPGRRKSPGHGRQNGRLSGD